jgi:CRP-like cAMP-binding protein
MALFHAENRLLARLSPGELAKLSPALHAVSLNRRETLQKVRSEFEYVYFPISGIISAMIVMRDGSAIEVATIGNEGMSGLTAFVGGKTSPYEVMVQVPGEALRMPIQEFRKAAAAYRRFRDLLVDYDTAFACQVAYAVACNGLHKIQQRCCRWLLMTHDRVGSNALPLTHEFLAIMLGVRRASVTEVLGPLQDLGVIDNNRGHIAIRDRQRLESLACECYQAVDEEFKRIFG